MSPPPLIEMMRQLIAAPSVSSIAPHWDQSNLKVIDLLHSWLEDLGMQVEVLPIPGRPGKFNLIATAGRGPDGLVLSGHTDTVPFDAGRWSSDPFLLDERDNRLYGLGTSDMKGFFALAIEVLREVDFRQLRHPLILLATADEESTMCGARSLVKLQRRLGRHALIGEPTGLRPIRQHKGITMETIRVEGRSGHSSDPGLGRNALEGMHQVIDELLQWRTDLQTRFRNDSFKVPVPTLNLGHIHGGDNPNRICADCELQIDIRPLPGMEIERLREELDQRLQRRLRGSGFICTRESGFSGTPPLETAAESAIVQAAEQLTGTPAGAVAFGTEAPYLKQLGMESLVLGPGDIEQAHQPDEYLGLERITPMLEILRQLIRRFCL